MALWSWAEPGPRWAFVVDTDSYAGNFERELSSFVVGRCDEHGEHRGGIYKEMYEEEVPKSIQKLFEDLVEERVDDHDDDFIGRAPMALVPTPGFENNGMGKIRRLKSGEKPKHPAYNSVAIFLSRKPKDKELRILVERSKRFSDLPAVKPWDHRPKILGLRLVEEHTEIISHNLGT